MSYKNFIFRRDNPHYITPNDFLEEKSEEILITSQKKLDITLDNRKNYWKNKKILHNYTKVTTIKYTTNLSLFYMS